MTLKSVTDAAALLWRHPILWSVGLVMGLLTLLDLIVPLEVGAFYTQPLLLLQVLVMPFLAGGIYGMIRERDFSGAGFVRSGKDCYFRILLPSFVIFFAVVLTVILLAIPLALIGGVIAVNMAALLLGVVLSIAFFTFFYDTAAAFERTKTFESIRRSVEFVMNNLWSVLVFYLINIVVLVLLGFVALFTWSALLVNKLEPLLTMSPAELQMLMPEDVLALIGTEGIWITAIIYAIVVALFSAFHYTYKASFFNSLVAGVIQLQGEYDEKGRWYKY
ncbi:hypothetical protein [Methanoculleus sp.]|jgi:uncharacterized membrane protein|uniref:DUF7847 domain-containing protein n=1 Tax=Methanoculleus sp. TaxID=90427 RepID=UPI00263137DA|nr:hypothetical protein [Methanoculleus sp.]MDI6866457.1 hypothetical protein [Methanoculleus sp.]